MNAFTAAFVIALTAGIILQLWLSRRHIQHMLSHRDRVPEHFADRVSLAAHQKAADYTVARVKLGQLELFVAAAVLLAWTLGGGLSWLQGFWDGLELNVSVSGTCFVLSVFLITGLFDLPVSAWQTFVLEERFGFNRSTPGRFFTDQLLQGVLLTVIGAPLVWAILWLMEETGGLWWLAAWLVWTGFTLFMIWAFPTLIAPLFNKFTPLEDGNLKQRIQQLLERCGFTSNGVFVMDGSRRSGHGNAYFTGFGSHKRIVFFDTLIESLSEPELEAVLAHELGHYKRRHVIKQLLANILLSFLGFAALGWLIGQAWFYTGLGINNTTHAAALILFVLAAPVFLVFFEPLGSLIMRKYEFEADAYAVQQTGPEALTEALVKLYRENASTLTPDPLYSAFHDSHPPAPVRIAQISAKIGG